MKDISEYTLRECLEEVEMLDSIYEQTRPVKLADRIHDLTRWIPVSERMPTKEDGDENGQVFVSETENESPHRKYSHVKTWNRLNDPDYFYTITHWKRITPPEDKV
jgi:hypothetical protein